MKNHPLAKLIIASPKLSNGTERYSTSLKNMSKEAIELLYAKNTKKLCTGDSNQVKPVIGVNSIVCEKHLKYVVDKTDVDIETVMEVLLADYEYIDSILNTLEEEQSK